MINCGQWKKDNGKQGIIEVRGDREPRGERICERGGFLQSTIQSLSFLRKFFRKSLIHSVATSELVSVQYTVDLFADYIYAVLGLSSVALNGLDSLRNKCLELVIFFFNLVYFLLLFSFSTPLYALFVLVIVSFPFILIYPFLFLTVYF